MALVTNDDAFDLETTSTVSTASLDCSIALLTFAYSEEVELCYYLSAVVRRLALVHNCLLVPVLLHKDDLDSLAVYLHYLVNRVDRSHLPFLPQDPLG